MSTRPKRRPEIEVSTRRRTSPRWLRVGFWACIVISVAVVVRRVYALVRSTAGRPSAMAALDAVFASPRNSHPGTHSPALAFVMVSAVRRFRGEGERVWLSTTLCTGSGGGTHRLCT